MPKLERCEDKRVYWTRYKIEKSWGRGGELGYNIGSRIGIFIINALIPLGCYCNLGCYNRYRQSARSLQQRQARLLCLFR